MSCWNMLSLHFLFQVSNSKFFILKKKVDPETTQHGGELVAETLKVNLEIDIIKRG